MFRNISGKLTPGIANTEVLSLSRSANENRMLSRFLEGLLSKSVQATVIQGGARGSRAILEIGTRQIEVAVDAQKLRTGDLIAVRVEKRGGTFFLRHIPASELSSLVRLQGFPFPVPAEILNRFYEAMEHGRADGEEVWERSSSEDGWRGEKDKEEASGNRDADQKGWGLTSSGHKSKGSHDSFGTDEPPPPNTMVPAKTGSIYHAYYPAGFRNLAVRGVLFLSTSSTFQEMSIYLAADESRKTTINEKQLIDLRRNVESVLFGSGNVIYFGFLETSKVQPVLTDSWVG